MKNSQIENKQLELDKQKLELEKDNVFIDIYKHMTTLITGAILLVGTLSEKGLITSAVNPSPFFIFMIIALFGCITGFISHVPKLPGIALYSKWGSHFDEGRPRILRLVTALPFLITFISFAFGLYFLFQEL